MQLDITTIRQDGGTQPRASYSFGVADSYAEDMEAGATFPPVVVFYDGTDYWLADGFHRVFAAKKIGQEAIDADVRQGTLEDAQWFSYSVNQAHGLRRSNEDKRRAVEAALKHPRSAGMSNRELATYIGVSFEYIGRVQKDLTIDQSIVRTNARTGRDGRTINTSNIGKKKPKPKPTTPNPIDYEPQEEERQPIDPEEAFDAMLAKFSVGVRRLCRDILTEDLPEETIQRMIDVFSQAIADRIDV